MFNSAALDIVIGLVFIYLLYSLLATILQEILATNFGFRAKILERSIHRMLEDDDKFYSRLKGIFYLFKKTGNDGTPGSPSHTFYRHPLVKFLGESSHHRKPAYLSSQSFSKILIDLLKGPGKAGEDARPLIEESLETGHLKWPSESNTLDPLPPQTLLYLQSVWAESQGDVDKFRALLENWYNQTQERSTGWYKKHTQIILLVVGLMTAIIFNVDTIQIIDKLEKDPEMRAQLVQQADAYVKAHPDLDKELKQEKKFNETLVNSIEDPLSRKDSLQKLNLQTEKEIREMRGRIDSLNKRAQDLIEEDISKANQLLGIGINNYQWNGLGELFLSVIGWMLTALAISFGAPFWFDLLNKLMKLRGSVAINSTEGNKEKSSEDKIKRVG